MSKQNWCSLASYECPTLAAHRHQSAVVSAQAELIEALGNLSQATLNGIASVNAYYVTKREMIQYPERIQALKNYDAARAKLLALEVQNA